jgi:hypothetical protein
LPVRSTLVANQLCYVRNMTSVLPQHEGFAIWPVAALPSILLTRRSPMR